MKLSLIAPIKLISEANQREHWRKKYNRKKEQQQMMAVFWRNGIKRHINLPCTVTLTRVGAKKLDSDNLAGCFKHVQDEIAWQLKTDDGGGLVQWVYKQQVQDKREYFLAVEIEEL